MDLQTLVDQFAKLAELKGHIGAIAFGVFLAVRLYRLPSIQAALPAKAQWDGLKQWAKYAALMALAALGGALASLSTGLGWPDALKAALAAVLAAIGSDQVTSTSGARAVAGVLVQQAPAPSPEVTPQVVPALPADHPTAIADQAAQTVWDAVVSSGHAAATNAASATAAAAVAALPAKPPVAPVQQ